MTNTGKIWSYLKKLWKHNPAMLVSLLYLVSPVDFMPLNPADDAVVMAISTIIEGVIQVRRIFTAS